MKEVTVLIPTINRTPALCATLVALASQTYQNFDIVISDQTEEYTPFNNQLFQTIIRILKLKGHSVALYRNLPAQGVAQQRAFLLGKAISPYVFFLDDDIILESFALKNMIDTIKKEKCGFVGMAPIGLSFMYDIRPAQQKIEFWKGRVKPEKIEPEGQGWNRYLLHNAANILHVQNQLKLTPKTPKKYKIAWVGASVLYDRKKLIACGGFSFWSKLPRVHCGEDVLAELRVMEKYGGCGILPSGSYHQELPTQIRDRKIDAGKYMH